MILECILSSESARLPENPDLQPLTAVQKPSERSPRCFYHGREHAPASVKTRCLKPLKSHFFEDGFSG
jgi:hypothetical protein